MTMHVPESHHIQARWTSVIRETVLRDAKLLKILPESETSTAKLPEHIHTCVGPLCKKLLERACQEQIAHPKATQRIEQLIATEIWNGLKPFSAVTFGQFEQLSFDPYLTPASTRKWVEHTTTHKPVQTPAQHNTRGPRS